MREIARFVMLGRIQAISIASIFGGVSLIFPPVSCLSAAVVGLIGLRKGWQEGVLVLLSSSVVILAISSMIADRPGITFPLVFMLLVPVLVCAWVLRKTESQSLTLLIASAFAGIFVIVMHLSVGDVVAWWANLLSEMIQRVKGASLQEFEKEGTLKLMNGLVAMMFGISTTVSVLLSRWWQALLYNPGGFAQEFHQLRLPKLVLPGTVAILLLAGTIDQIFLADLFMVSIMMFFFQGLAVIHCIITKRNLSNWWLTPIYLGLVLMPQYLMTGLALVGAIDNIAQFRVRSSKR